MTDQPQRLSHGGLHLWAVGVSPRFGLKRDMWFPPLSWTSLCSIVSLAGMPGISPKAR